MEISRLKREKIITKSMKNKILIVILPFVAALTFLHFKEMGEDRNSCAFVPTEC